MILFADGEGPDQTARMRRLMWASAVRICRIKRFCMEQPILRITPNKPVDPNVDNGLMSSGLTTRESIP